MKLHKYFENTFEFIEDETKFSCSTCKEGNSIVTKKGKSTVKLSPAKEKYIFQKRWLIYHMLNPTHQGFESNKAEMIEAINLVWEPEETEIPQKLTIEDPN